MKQGATLLRYAMQAREAAYAPYSGFRVGAALLSTDGRVFCGCNVENAAHTPTCCAERVAIFKAVSEGVRSFAALAVVGGRDDRQAGCEPCPPCGVCRQALAEFAAGEMPVYLAGTEKEGALTLAELLPFAFGGDRLK